MRIECQNTCSASCFSILSFLLCFPVMLDGVTMLRKITWKSRRRQPYRSSTSAIIQRGTRTLKRIYGDAFDRLHKNLNSLHDIVPNMIIRDVYGRIISRSGFLLRERKIVNLAVLRLRPHDQQLFSHTRGTLKLRVTQKKPRTIILHLC